MEKATFRLPEWQLQRMRERSREEGRSLNSVAADVIANGLEAHGPDAELRGEPRAILTRALGPLLSRPARANRRPVRRSRSSVRLTDALDWVRDEG